MNLRPLSVDHSTAIGAPPSEVWRLIADPGERADWMTEVVRVDTAAGPLSVGDRFTAQSSLLLHDFIGVSEVRAADHGERLVEEVIIGARFVSRWELTPHDGGTSVRHSIDVQFPGGPFSRLERFVVRRRLLRMQRESLRRLAQRFETFRHG